MKRATILSLALLTAACGSNAEELAQVDDSGPAQTDTNNGLIAAQIAEAEARSGRTFSEMTLDERAEVLGKRDAFGNLQRPGAPAQETSFEDLRERARREAEAGY
ncbi:hypothetical protein [Erythrobacter sp.]|uniref:hypothetical protein n=1 Tax=Erythrobacter sp. TaxID=1042 RepID=UPI001B18AA94|nr:hypothetical protein [Erythrobacter sp.]MBO6527850.1 hypothetical protein [Erythrobacter sp.]MBO6530283.1 hypothetical protein [Erythrobacter sp.]